MSWWEHANCRGVDTELFFPERGEYHNQRTAEALNLCHACTVRDECLEDALDQRDVYGIRGGLSERQRSRLRPTRRWSQKRWCIHCHHPFVATNRAQTLCSDSCKQLRTKQAQRWRETG